MTTWLRHPLVRYALVATPVCLLVFLGSSDFVTGWNGHVVGQRPAMSEDPVVARVLIVTPDGDSLERDWPLPLVQRLDVPVNRLGVAPREVPESAARTVKAPFSLHYTVDLPGDEESPRVFTTAGFGPVSVAVLLWLLGLALWNMFLSGSPLDWRPREVALPPSQSPTLQPEAPRNRPKKGPPPPRPRRGIRR